MMNFKLMRKNILALDEFKNGIKRIEESTGVIDSMYRDLTVLAMGSDSLLELVDDSGWEKDTISYATSNYSKLAKIVKGSMSSAAKDTYSEAVEDVLQDVLCYFYKSPDYSYDRAKQASTDRGLTKVMSLDSFVEGTVRLHVKKLNTLARNESEIRADNYIIEEDRELNLIDVLPDESGRIAFLETEYNLDDQLKALEVKRYTYGIDIYNILYTYARLGSKFRRVLEVLGYPQKDINEFRSKVVNDSDIMDLLHILEQSKDTEVTDKISDYVYGIRDIDRGIAYIISQD